MVAEPGYDQRSSRDLADSRMNVAPSSAQVPSHEEAAVTTNSTAGGVYTFPTPYLDVKNNNALLESGPSSGNSCGEFPSSGEQRMKSKKRASASSRGTQDEGSCFTASQFPGIAEEKGGGNLRTRQKQRLLYNKRGVSRGFSRSSCTRHQRNALRAKLWRDEKIAKSRIESLKHSPDKLSGLEAPEQGGSRVSVDGNTCPFIGRDKLAAGMGQVTAGFKAMSEGFSEVENQVRSQMDQLTKELAEMKQRLAQVEEQQEQHKAEVLQQRKDLEADSAQVGAQVGASPVPKAKPAVKAKPVDAKVVLAEVKPGVAVVKPDATPVVKPADAKPIDVGAADVKPVAVKPAADVKPVVAVVKPDAKVKPVVDDVKPGVAVVKPDATPVVKPAEAKSIAAAVKPGVAVVKPDVKPVVVEAKDKPAIVRPAKDEPSSQVGASPATKAKPVAVKSAVAKPVAVEVDKPAKAKSIAADVKLDAKSDAEQMPEQRFSRQQQDSSVQTKRNFEQEQELLETTLNLIEVLQQVESMALILESDQRPLWFDRNAPHASVSIRDPHNPFVWLQVGEMHQVHDLLDEALVLAQEILDKVHSCTGQAIKGEIPSYFRKFGDASILSSTQIWFDLMWNWWKLHGRCKRPLLTALHFMAELHAWIDWQWMADQRRFRDDPREAEIFLRMGSYRFEIGSYSKNTTVSLRINLQMAFDSVQSSLAQIDRELSMLLQSDRGFYLLRKHGWGSTAHPCDVTNSLVFQTRAAGDRSGIGFDAPHARGRSRGDKANRVSCNEVNVNFIPFPRARNKWHNILREQQEKMHWPLVLIRNR